MRENNCKHLNLKTTEYLIEGYLEPILTIVICLDCKTRII